MQLIESVLVLLVLIQLVFLFIDQKEKQSLAFVGLGLLAFHFILGEGRWQMFFLYLIEVILIGIYLKRTKSSRWMRVIGCFFAVILTAASAILAYALPVFSLPSPTGAFNVGLEKLYIPVDSREETITKNPSDKRELMVNVWYPTNNPTEVSSPFLPQVERVGFATKYGLPPAALNYLNKVETHHQRDAQPADGQFPVLIFSPGYYTPASGYLSIIEDLVSHGFIVFNIIHPHETMGVEYPDGRNVFFNMAFSEANSWGWNDDVASAVNTLQSSNDNNEKRKATRQMVNTYGKDIVKRWAADMGSIIDELTQLNSDPSFTLQGKLDLERLATFGHSVGGSAAIEAAIFDERIKAAVNLDGAQWGSLMDTVLNKPCALISSSDTYGQPDVNKYIFEKSQGKDFQNLVLRNSGHSNFSDIPFMIRVQQLNEAGSISPTIAAQNTTAFLSAFFKKHLLNEAIDLEDWVDSNPYLVFH